MKPRKNLELEEYVNNGTGFDYKKVKDNIEKKKRLNISQASTRTDNYK